MNDAKQYANRAALWISLIPYKSKTADAISTILKSLKEKEGDGNSIKIMPKNFQVKLTNNQSKEETMGLALLEQENVSNEVLKELFEKAFYKVSVSDDVLIIQDEGRRLNKYAAKFANNKQIKFFAMITSKETQAESRLNYCSRMNQELNTLRVYITDQCVTMDWYIPLKGGITETNVIMSFKYFQSQIDEALNRDTAGIFK